MERKGCPLRMRRWGHRPLWGEKGGAARDDLVGTGEGQTPSPHPAGLGAPSPAVPALQAPWGALHPPPSERDPPIRTLHALSPTQRKRGAPRRPRTSALGPRVGGGGWGWRGPRPRPTSAKPRAEGAAAGSQRRERRRDGRVRAGRGREGPRRARGAGAARRGGGGARRGPERSRCRGGSSASPVAAR